MGEPIIINEQTSSSVNCVYIFTSSLNDITVRNNCETPMQFTVYFSNAGNFTYHIDGRWRDSDNDANTERVIKNRNIQEESFARIISEEKIKC